MQIREGAVDCKCDRPRCVGRQRARRKEVRPPRDVRAFPARLPCRERGAELPALARDPREVCEQVGARAGRAGRRFHGQAEAIERRAHPRQPFVTRRSSGRSDQVGDARVDRAANHALDSRRSRSVGRRARSRIGNERDA